MAQIGLVVRPGVKRATELGSELISWAEKNGHQLDIDKRTASIMGLKEGLSRIELLQRCDPIITLGGDGTLIGVARHVNGSSPRMIGVNFGTLGFLTEISPDEVFSVLESTLKDECDTGERYLLRASVVRGGREVFSSSVINDAVVQKGSRDKLLDMKISADESDVMSLRADGMILSTPTGSTAYSLAAGGSIVHPRLDGILVTPICPHSLTVRPFILPGFMEVRVLIQPYEGEVFLSLDGQDSYALEPNDEIVVCKSEKSVRFVRSPRLRYFDILRNKLHWGVENKA